MDVKEQVMKAVEKISKDKELQEQFRKEPVNSGSGSAGGDDREYCGWREGQTDGRQGIRFRGRPERLFQKIEKRTAGET